MAKDETDTYMKTRGTFFTPRREITAGSGSLTYERECTHVPVVPATAPYLFQPLVASSARSMTHENRS
jgi:hypothetical protein